MEGNPSQFIQKLPSFLYSQVVSHNSHTNALLLSTFLLTDKNLADVLDMGLFTVSGFPASLLYEQVIHIFQSFNQGKPIQPSTERRRPYKTESRISNCCAILCRSRQPGWLTALRCLGLNEKVCLELGEDYFCWLVKMNGQPTSCM